MFEDASKLWWDEIRGPAAFVRAIVKELEGAKTALVLVPEELPWREQMRNSVEHSLHGSDPELMIDYLDCDSACPAQRGERLDIAGLLLERYANSDTKSGYRQSSGLSIQQYMVANKVLAPRVIWITNAWKTQVCSWIDFCKGYRARSRYDGLFVIETHQALVRDADRRSMHALRYTDHVSYYDALLFNHLLCSTAQCTMEWMQYKATVSALLCGCDVELAKAVLEQTDFSAVSPTDTLKSLAAKEARAGRCHENLLAPGHPFSLMGAGNADALRSCVWRGQLQVIFPLLETERIRFIERYKRDIEEALGVEYLDFKKGTGRFLTQYGERVTDAMDAELGTLYRMQHLRRAADPSLYLLFLPREEDRERMELLHFMRNSIAHGEPCSVEKVNQFLALYPYNW